MPPSAADAARAHLTAALAPSEAMVGRITSDPTLLALFDDPEVRSGGKWGALRGRSHARARVHADAFARPQVMAVVSEVAADPGAYKRHAAKPKVRQFYALMSGVAADQLDRVQPQQQPAQQQHGAQQAASKPKQGVARIVEL